jgi:ribose 5-phosphate isomerase
MSRQVTEAGATELLQRYRRAAAERAVEFVDSGMVVGLGTGRTATFAVNRIGALLESGLLRGIRCVPSSRVTAALARHLGIPMLDPAEQTITLDLTIDGADEVDPELNLIKGGGGALLREKILAASGYPASVAGRGTDLLLAFSGRVPGRAGSAGRTPQGRAG